MERRAGSEATREMRDVDHTHPHTGEPFGAPHEGTADGAVAADGGAAGEADEETEVMADVDHESPHEAGANRAFERGTEGRTDTV